MGVENDAVVIAAAIVALVIFHIVASIVIAIALVILLVIEIGYNVVCVAAKLDLDFTTTPSQYWA